MTTSGTPSAADSTYISAPNLSIDIGGTALAYRDLGPRALPDKELDAFVETLAVRLSGFDKQALAGAKAQVNRATLPPDADLLVAYTEYSQSLAWPGFLARRPRIGKLAAEHGPAELERQLGHYIGLAN